MVNSSKTKVPLKFGWLVRDRKYHIAITSNTYYISILVYVCLCDITNYLDNAVIKDNHYIWPDGNQCIEELCKDTICLKCLNLYGEDLTFPLIKAKLGVKNPFD